MACTSNYQLRQFGTWHTYHELPRNVIVFWSEQSLHMSSLIPQAIDTMFICNTSSSQKNISSKVCEWYLQSLVCFHILIMAFLIFLLVFFYEHVETIFQILTDIENLYGRKCWLAMTVHRKATLLVVNYEEILLEKLPK